MQLVEYMSNAQHTLGQITTGQQWQRQHPSSPAHYY